DPTNELLEAASLRGRRATQAEISVDHVDVGFMPSEFAGALAKRILQPQAFLIAHHLVGRRLSDVDDCLARQVGRLDEFGLHERSPPGPRRRPRRSGAAIPAATLPKGPLGLCS